jgi:hypothetical protein
VQGEDVRAGVVPYGVRGVLGRQDCRVVDVGVQDALLGGGQRFGKLATVGAVDAGVAAAQVEELLLHRRRLESARRLLMSGEPVGRTAFLSGFDDVDTFCRAFKREFGASPSSLHPPRTAEPNWSQATAHSDRPRRRW